MKTYSDEAGYAAIQVAQRILPTAKETAIVRLFAIAMCFYRHPVGDAAFDHLRAIIGAEALNALCFISGYSAGGGQDWATLAALDVAEQEIARHASV